jgi:hypothetical protein
MEFKRMPDGGLLFRLEAEDWQGDWRTFLDGVKLIPGWEYCPAGMPKGEKWWYIPREGRKECLEFYRQSIFNVIHANQLELFPASLLTEEPNETDV